ncbi:MFS transporter [Streptacidiphilus rugosus]|uniref:MFS transporter n=1 Tax=Streptacidiphilus rugosus TaxID=405783 RepID=UPI000689BD5B|nr:MFS transporter [Streptacidiphilus rugosus]
MSSSAPDQATRWRSSAPLIAALGLATMVVSMAQTQVVPILPLLAHDLHASSSGVSWITTATLLSAAVFTPLLGRVGDLYDKKRTLLAVLAVMIAGSLLAATTTSLPLLIAGRALQGAATAIFPLALSIIRDQLPAERLSGAMALVSSALAVGSGLSLVLTGLLTQGTSPDYHAVFWISAALAALALVAVAFLAPASRRGPGGRTDYLGALTLTGLLILLLLGISQGRTWGWTSAATLGCLTAACLLAALFALVEHKVAEPLVDMRILTSRQIAFTNVAGLLVGFAMFAQFIGISTLAQTPRSLTGYGFSASVLRASVEYLLPGSLIALIVAQAGGILVRKTSARTTLALGTLIGVAGFALLTFAHDSSNTVISAGLLTGTSISLAYAAMPALIAASVPPHETGIANGINSVSRSTGSAIGSAVVTSLLTTNTLHDPPPGIPALPQEGQLTLTFAIGMTALLLALPATLIGITKPTPTTPRGRVREVQTEALDGSR